MFASTELGTERDAGKSANTYSYSFKSLEGKLVENLILLEIFLAR